MEATARQSDSAAAAMKYLRSERNCAHVRSLLKERQPALAAALAAQSVPCPRCGGLCSAEEVAAP